jgi:hypothetical protein
MRMVEKHLYFIIDLDRGWDLGTRLPPVRFAKEIKIQD